MKNACPGITAASFSELKNIRTITTLGLLVTMKIILDFVTIQFSPTMFLSFEFLVGSVVGMLFGPVAGALYGAGGDLLCFLVNPKGPYFIGFTLIAVIGGVINGYLYYKKPITLPRVIVGRTINVLVCQVVLNTLCISILYSKFFWVMLPARLIKNALMLPIEIALLYFVLKKVSSLKQFNK